MRAALLLPLLGHFALVVALYVWLTVARARAVRAHEARIGDFARAGGDPKSSARIQRNLANQFEALVFAHFAALYLIVVGAAGLFDVVAAWIFLAGRVVHTAVQTLGDDVTLRGRVFVINFVGILMLMGHVAVHVLSELLP